MRKSQSKFSLVFLFFLLFTISLIFAEPQVRLTEVVWKFGKLGEGVTAYHRIGIRNIGTEGLGVNIRSSCDCLQVQPEKLSLVPRGATDLKINLYTQGYPGKFGKYIYLDTNDPENPYVTLLIKGEIISRIDTNKIHELTRIKGEHELTRIKEKKPVEKPSLVPRPSLSVISVTMFSSFNCLFCRELREKILPSLEKKYGMKISVREYSLDEPKNYEILISLEKKLGKSENKMPVLFIGEDVLGGDKKIRQELSNMVEKYVALGGAKEIEIAPIEKEILRKEILSKFKQFRLLPVLFAGFIDGLNPCAFAAIVFFIAYLTMILKKPKREIFFTGLSFILGVFITYFLIGLGLARLLQTIKGLTLLSQVLYFLIGLLTLILAYFSFRDYFAVKKLEKGQEGKVVLQLPQFFRWKIYEVIEKQAKLKYFIVFAFISGVLISILEFFCTGQVYLPTIIYMITQITNYKLQITGYLVLYSLMFILPLVIIFGLVYFGVSSEKIEMVGRRHIATVKFLTGLIFLFLSLSMFAILYRLF